MNEFPDEEVLPDDYPVYGNYLYVADGKVYMSDWHDITVRALKIHENFAEVRRCNIEARRRARVVGCPAQREGS
jgi:hypothetical protein